jgi:hypothetical protein
MTHPALNRRHLLLPLCAAALPRAAWALDATPKLSAPIQYKLGDKLAASPAPVINPGAYKEISWDALVPKDWDPLKRFRATDLSKLKDSDPRADALLREMRAAWDNAPLVNTLAGQAIRIPGFVVPLDDGSAGLREFLLVPYFGGCIHSPPPPANQIIHVQTTKPLASVTVMTPIWVHGTLQVQRSDSAMGVSGYKVANALLALYEEMRAK